MMFFIGWDDREQDAWKVCAHSLVSRASCPIKIDPLKHRALRKLGLFRREWRIDATGQYWDVEDGRPFSTEFAFTRFLVPELADRIGLRDQWAFFVDADFLFLADVAELKKELDPSKAVMVVKHDHRPANAVKMDGVIQAAYPRKNWSSLIAFNLGHPSNLRLTTETVNSATGSFLHGFGWLKDEEIGALNPAWNRLVGHRNATEEVRALHYTDGGPWLDGWLDGPDDYAWVEEYQRAKPL